MSKSNWQSDEHAPQMHSLECTAYDPCESNAEEIPLAEWESASMGSLCASVAPEPELKITISFDRPQEGSTDWPMRLKVKRDDAPYLDLLASFPEKDFKALGLQILKIMGQ